MLPESYYESFLKHVERCPVGIKMSLSTNGKINQSWSFLKTTSRGSLLVKKSVCRSLSRVQLFVTPWFMGFFGPEYCSGLPWPSTGD